MKRVSAPILALGCILALYAWVPQGVSFAQFAPAYQQFYNSGTQSATVASIVPVNKNNATFIPLQIVVLNDDAANNLWVRLDGGTASNAGTDGLTVKLKKLEFRSFSFPQDNGPSSISIVSDAGLTTAYRIEAYR